MKPLENIIVTRHAGLLRWLTAKGVVGDALTHISNPAQIRGKRVIGVVPLHLAAEAEEVLAVVMPDLPPEARGRELTAEEMDAYGARLLRCAVLKIDEGYYPIRGDKAEPGCGMPPVVGRGEPFGYVRHERLWRLLDPASGGDCGLPAAAYLEHVPAAGEPEPLGVSEAEAAALEGMAVAVNKESEG